MAVIGTPFAEPNRPGAAATSCALAAVQRGPLTAKFLICAVTGLVGSSELGSLAGCSSEIAFLCRSARFAATVCRLLKCVRQLLIVQPWFHAPGLASITKASVSKNLRATAVVDAPSERLRASGRQPSGDTYRSGQSPATAGA